MTHNEAVVLIATMGCSLFSALCSGYVLWTLDRLFKDIYGRMESQEDRIGKVEGVLMERHS